MSSFKEVFDHFVGDRGRGRTKGFHKELIRKLNVQITDISFRVSFPETPKTPARRSDLEVGHVSLAGTSLGRVWETMLHDPECEEHRARCKKRQHPGPNEEERSVTTHLTKLRFLLH